MADVARAAGVSMQTVSRVSNGHSNVLSDTRDRVEAAMRQLGYRPNRAARSLRSGRFQSVGVILFTLSSIGNMRTLEAIAGAAAAAGYSLSLISAADRTPVAIAQAFARLEEQTVDGVVLVVESHLVDESEIVFPPDLPVVLVDSSKQEHHSLVDTDQTQGARLATEHLLGLGHRTVHHVSGPAGSYSADRRERGWRDTLVEAGRDAPPVLRGDWTTDSGYRAGRELLERSDVTAVFAGNDQMALGLMRALHEAGRPVPGSISVVGFDDMPEAESFWPPLTTVHQYFDEVGRRSIEALVEAIENEDPGRRLVVPTTLVVRESTAPPST